MEELSTAAASVHTCAVCHTEAEQRCASCGVVYYCGRDHQRRHWKVHRASCRCYKVERNPVVGRHLTASRDVKAGEVILQDTPLVWGPKNFHLVCLGCYRSVDGSFECPKCGWPMCGEACCHSEDHQPECHMTLKYLRDRIHIEGSREEKESNFDYMQCITILRCLYLRDTQPDRWQELINLEAHSPERERLGLQNLERLVIVRFLREEMHLSSDDYPDQLILKMCGILYVNSFEVPHMGEGLQAVYGKVSLLEHDCLANAVNSILPSKEIVVRAAIPISKGEKIAITYTDPMWGTCNRQHHLLQTKFFRCRCDRCRDPTELGTMMSAITCRKCFTADKGGYLLSRDPLEDDSQWVCNVCGDTKPASYVQKLIEDVGKELVILKDGTSKSCEAFLKKFENVLHPHHFYLAEVKMVLCQMFGHLQGQQILELSDDNVGLKETLCLELLKIFDMIAPGMTRLRAMILYEMQAVMALRSRRLWMSGEIDKDELKSHVKVVRRMLQEAATIFSWEPEESDEGQLAVIAQKELQDVDIFMRTLV